MIATPSTININASKIDLSNQSLREFPTELFRCKNLKKLNLSKNQISYIPKEISALSRLEKLDLSENKISVLYSKIFELKKLKTFIINNNSLKRIPKQIGRLENLKILGLAGNEITELPIEISRLTSLEELNISNNPIVKFPTELLEISSLTTLWINNNTFNSFPTREIVSNLKNLKAIYTYSALMYKMGNLDPDYSSITGYRGNTISYLKALAEKKKASLNSVTDNNNLKGVDKLSLVVESMKEVDLDETNKEETSNVQKHNIFISYSHKDKEWLETINPYLKGMQLEGLRLDFWVDTRIKTGQKWKIEIEKALQEAHIAILLISQDFLASEFIQNNELPFILENAEKRGVKILPVILSPCRFTKTKSLKEFQALNDPKTPLNTMEKHQIQLALLQLTEEIEKSIEQ